MIKNSTEVLVIGAGPTGLFLALVLARLGIRSRVVDSSARYRWRVKRG
jgi:2-polyprenyl-6-methoxyphenol hydroxylase-like FAD-dependent oxidoreductase